MSVAHPGRRKREQYGDRIIVLVYLWSVLHERPVCWACVPKNWPVEPPWQLPSDSTMSRRLETIGVKQLLERVTAAASELFPVTLVKVIDSKPLLVGAYSKDRDAKRGRTAKGQMTRGYRLHALTHGRAVQHWCLAPMNDHDSVHAPTLLAKLRGGGGSGGAGFGYVVADNAYDSNDLHRASAAHNHQMLAPARAVNRGVRDARSTTRAPAASCFGPAGQPAAILRGQPGVFGRELYNKREAVESCFGELTMMGLNYLPAWVRGPRRVALWTAGKILLYLCKRAEKQGLMK